MDSLSKNIAVNLKKIRRARGMSLDNVAELTGVSKSMLGQIEREEANPTIGIMGKICSGLRVELSDLTDAPEKNLCFIDGQKLQPVKGVEGRYRVYRYFPSDHERHFELYRVVIEPGCEYVSAAHREGSMEYLCVSRGVLTLQTRQMRQELRERDAIRIEADQDHIYLNRGEDTLEIIKAFFFS